MCGIVGVMHEGSTVRMAVDALKRLEYRGYDSFGVSVLRGDRIETKKAIGSVSGADDRGFFDGIGDGSMSIAHTRWATHGGVTEVNAHPHVSFDGTFSVVHNGVIDNYREIKKRLMQSGIECVSATDTEVIAHLLAMHFNKTKNVTEALRATLQELEGEYALVFITTRDTQHIYGARKKSPLGFGIKDGVAMFASDQRAIGHMTSDMVFLEDNDIAILDSDSAKIFCRVGKTLKKVSRKHVKLLSICDDDKLDGHAHYMQKEIHENPFAVDNVLKIRQSEIDFAVSDISKKSPIITGIGSAYYAAQIGQYYFSKLARTYVRTHPSDEILSLVQFTAKDHLIALSQSGETFDTLEAMKSARSGRAKITAINNVLGSSANRMADFPIFQGSGSEVCVLSTKSVVSQSLILYRLAIALGKRKKILSPKTLKSLTADEKKLSETMSSMFGGVEDKARLIAGSHPEIDNWFFIGRDIHYPVAMESALKFKEVSYLHAEGMPAGFFKHGTISLIDDRFVTIAFLPKRNMDQETYRMTVSNIAEIQARGGRVIVVCHDENIEEDTGPVENKLVLPSINQYLDPILELVAGQMLGYYCGVALGRNIDKPRALAKSVTVR